MVIFTHLSLDLAAQEIVLHNGVVEPASGTVECLFCFLSEHPLRASLDNRLF
jgi:hypothetical protein